MIRALLADDEEASALLLAEALEATGKVEVVATAAAGLECLRLMEEYRPEVLFLDIQMADLSGLEVAQIALEQAAPPLIVFITGYERYAVRAFELAALDYVVKPADLGTFEERLRTTVSRIEEVLAQPRPPCLEEMREVLGQLARQAPGLARPVRLPVREFDAQTLRLLDPRAVVYAEGDAAGVRLYTTEKAYDAYHSLDGLAARLAEERFLPVTPGALVNLEYVSHLLPNADGSYDVLLQAQEGDFLHTIVVQPDQAQALLGQLGL